MALYVALAADDDATHREAMVGVVIGPMASRKLNRAPGAITLPLSWPQADRMFFAKPLLMSG